MANDLVIGAKAPGKDVKTDIVGNLTVQAPETIDESIQMYGADAVLSNAMKSWFTCRLDCTNRRYQQHQCNEKRCDSTASCH